VTGKPAPPLPAKTTTFFFFPYINRIPQALSDAACLFTPPVSRLQALFDDFRRDFVSADSLKEAEHTAAAELASALQRSSALETRLGEEQVRATPHAC
jgi:hypothetical protein